MTLTWSLTQLRPSRSMQRSSTARWSASLTTRAGDLPYEKSVRRYYDFTHMANVVRAGAAQLATSPEGLREKIVNYLEKPDLDRPGRQRIVKQQFGRVDGLSAARLVEQAAALISKGKTK